MSRPANKERNAAIAAAYRGGATIAEIASQVGVNYQCVYYHLKRSGVMTRRKRARRHDAEIEAGVREIAKRLGLSAAFVARRTACIFGTWD